MSFDFVHGIGYGVLYWILPTILILLVLKMVFWLTIKQISRFF